MTNELNIKIAQVLGYRIEIIERESSVRADYHLALVAPDNRGIHAAWYTAPDDFAYVFNHVFELGKLPDWQRDLNAAMPLFLELPKPSSISFYARDNAWSVTYDEDIQCYAVYSVDNDSRPQSLAVAICQAWLQWKGVSDE